MTVGLNVDQNKYPKVIKQSISFSTSHDDVLRQRKVPVQLDLAHKENLWMYIEHYFSKTLQQSCWVGGAMSHRLGYGLSNLSFRTINIKLGCCEKWKHDLQFRWINFTWRNLCLPVCLYSHSSDRLQTLQVYCWGPKWGAVSSARLFGWCLQECCKVD